VTLKGEVPSPLSIPAGCRFHPRCSYWTDICTSQEPPLRQIVEGRMVACHNYWALFGKEGPDDGDPNRRTK